MNSQRSRFERLEGKIDEMLKHQVDMKIDLAEHMRRTDLLEKKVEILEPLITIIKATIYVGAACGSIYGVVRLIQAITQ